MKNGWLDRLESEVKSDPRSLNQISKDAGLGRNFIQQLITDKKEPGSNKLAKILDILGETSALYVLTGVRAKPEDLDFLKEISQLDDETRTHATHLFRSLRKPAGEQERPASPADPAAPKSEKSR